RTERRGVARHQVLPAPALLGHESGALQDGHVLLHRGEAHRVLAGQRRDRVLLAQRAPDDVPSRGVGEGVEQLIDVGLIYNHTVVYSPGPARAQGPTGDGSKRKGLIPRLTMNVRRGSTTRDCTCWCGFGRVASRRVLSRFAYPCDLCATQRRRGVRQTDARLLAVAAAADSMIVTTSAGQARRTSDFWPFRVALGPAGSPHCNALVLAASRVRGLSSAPG